MSPSLALPHPEAKARAGELIRRFGLDHRRGHTPAALSAGECQRVALARALFGDPDLILADEPTGNLDEDNSQTVLTHLAEMARDGHAVLVVTHDKLVGQYADKTVALSPPTADSPETDRTAPQR